MPHKVKLILNPMADLGRAWKTANDLRPIAQEFKGELSWSGTVYPTHAIELAKQAAEEGCDIVVAMGGDGTVHEVMNGLMQVPANKRPMHGHRPHRLRQRLCIFHGHHRQIPRTRLQTRSKAKIFKQWMLA